ncbi:hypothetical protein KVT40_002359 [Elsinoe batatas]|uniref:DRBM domain-containing protein n=1 Tax=Elsinoe batatas TaxID=2601811 RepID=A0A8K0L8H8_9PEZI|nr:hypothetical protein KVT40_002359 [Elsinoe batatas]
MAPAASSTILSDSIDGFSQAYDFINLAAMDGLSTIPAASTSRHIDCDNDTLVWVGKFAADAIMARSVVKKLAGKEDKSMLDLFLAQAHVALLRVPPPCLTRESDNYLQATTRDFLNSQSNLLRRLGNIVVYGNEQRRQSVEAEIVRIIESEVLDDNKERLFNTGRHATQHVREPNGTARVEHRGAHDQHIPEIQHYSIAVLEYARAEKEDIFYSYEQTDYRSPPSFRARLVFRGEEHTGHGSSKKIAKHMASKEAYESLDIVVRG